MGLWLSLGVVLKINRSTLFRRHKKLESYFRPGNDLYLSGSLNQYLNTLCESTGFCNIAIRIRDDIPRLIALQSITFAHL